MIPLNVHLAQTENNIYAVIVHEFCADVKLR